MLPSIVICYRDAQLVANICYCHKCMVLLIQCMHFCVVFVMRSSTQRKTTAAASGKTKRKSSVFTNNSVNISLRLFYNSLPLPRLCYVLVSNGWLDSGSNSNIRKSDCAGERHVFGIWGVVQSHHPLIDIMASRKRGLSVYDLLCTKCLL